MSAVKKERGVDLLAVVIAGLVFVAFAVFVLVRHVTEAKNSATAVTSSAAAIIYGQSVTLSATVAPTNGHGTVAFEDGHVPIQNCTRVRLTKSESSATTTTTAAPGAKVPKPGTVYVARCTTSSIGAGKRTLQAYYSGDRAYNKSEGAVQVRVKRLGTTIAVTSSLTTSNAYEAVTFTAAVASIDNGGTVTFSYHNTAINGCTDRPLTVSGADHIATCTTAALAPGKFAIRATYHGDKNHAPSSSTVRQIVKKLGTRAAIAASPNPARLGNAVTFVATVSPNNGSGTFAFYADGHAIAGCTAVALTAESAGYQAACTTSSLKRGSNDVRAIYRDAFYVTASATLHERVNA